MKKDVSCSTTCPFEDTERAAKPEIGAGARQSVVQAAPGSGERQWWDGAEREDLEHELERGARADQGVLARAGRERAARFSARRERGCAQEDEGAAEALLRLCRLRA